MGLCEQLGRHDFIRQNGGAAKVALEDILDIKAREYHKTESLLSDYEENRKITKQEEEDLRELGIKAGTAVWNAELKAKVQKKKKEANDELRKAGSSHQSLEESESEHHESRRRKEDATGEWFVMFCTRCGEWYHFDARRGQGGGGGARGGGFIVAWHTRQHGISTIRCQDWRSALQAYDNLGKRWAKVLYEEESGEIASAHYDQNDPGKKAYGMLRKFCVG